ncbi:hypothetical protein [Sphingopyxis sp. QXT-31]|uniref:hypothetical protein n=1 Tax=Sphingopyxis sp. QXT-31 TaxID=1357916 RepID=UPI0012EB5C27|nr:hypothetical protein [Sphingopyxis sp. QXT-31]
MIEARLVGRHISSFADVLGFTVVVPDRFPEGDPEYGMDRYIEYPDRGFTILVNSADVCSCVQFFDGRKEPDYEQYAGTFPYGLTFDSSRTDVRSAMGVPVYWLEDARFDFPPPILPWDWFAHDGVKIHFEYSETKDRVVMVSVMPLPE